MAGGRNEEEKSIRSPEPSRMSKQETLMIKTNRHGMIKSGESKGCRREKWQVEIIGSNGGGWVGGSTRAWASRAR